MKLLKLSLFALVVCFMSLTSCQSDSKVKDAKDSLGAATTTSPTSTVTKVENPTKKADAVPVVPTGPLTKMEFDDTNFDFGTINDGDKVRHIFKFKNTGGEPLLISNCKGSCGCTVPECPKEPIAPGASGEITVEYNSRGKGGVGGKPDQKFVQVIANTDPGTSRLTIKANVVKEEGAADAKVK